MIRNTSLHRVLKLQISVIFTFDIEVKKIKDWTSRLKNKRLDIEVKNKRLDIKEF